jgi:hypothetical protein
MIKKMSLMNYLKTLIYGIAFGLIVYLLTAGADPVGNISGTVSIALGLLVIYLEYKFYDKVKK